MTEYPRCRPGSQPVRLHDGYKSTERRNPHRPLISIPHTLSEITGPVYGNHPITGINNDLTRQYDGEPQGQRILVSGRVLDEDGSPLPNMLVEIWQANAAGRYRHPVDAHAAPLDPNFSGAGRTITDEEGRYVFLTIKPGAYPWHNHPNAWRPAHIHFSLFGSAFVSRLTTQMYFPDDPLIPYDPILQSIPDEQARQRLVSRFDLETTEELWALGYRWDIVLRGRAATPFEGQ
jgi:protocatechuate 3,4-dioxygenase beta subunit